MPLRQKAPRHVTAARVDAGRAVLAQIIPQSLWPRDGLHSERNRRPSSDTRPNADTEIREVGKMGTPVFGLLFALCCYTAADIPNRLCDLASGVGSALRGPAGAAQQPVFPPNLRRTRLPLTVGGQSNVTNTAPGFPGAGLARDPGLFPVAARRCRESNGSPPVARRARNLFDRADCVHRRASRRSRMRGNCCEARSAPNAILVDIGAILDSEQTETVGRVYDEARQPSQLQYYVIVCIGREFGNRVRRVAYFPTDTIVDALSLVPEFTRRPLPECDVWLLQTSRPPACAARLIDWRPLFFPSGEPTETYKLLPNECLLVIGRHYSGPVYWSTGSRKGKITVTAGCVGPATLHNRREGEANSPGRR